MPLRAFAHPARGLQPLSAEIALDLRPRIREVGLVPEPHVLRVPRDWSLPGLRSPDLVDGLVGVLDHVELADGLARVGQMLADALGEPKAHVCLWSNKPIQRHHLGHADLFDERQQ